MNDRETILNENEFFADTIDAQNEGVEQNKKRECLKYAVNNGDMKGLIQPVMKSLIKYMQNTRSVN